MPQTPKILSALTLAFALSTLSACKSEIDEKPKAKVEDAEKPTEKPKTKADEASAVTTLALAKEGTTIAFIGAKITDDHRGSFSDFKGSATIEGGKVTSMNISVDIASMVIEPADLAKHLKGEDFFNASKHPKAEFTSLSIVKKAGEGGATHEIAGNLELKGMAKKVTFPATLEIKDGSVHGKAEFSVDRKLWGITYPGKPDDLIKDEVALELDLNFAKA